MKGDATMFMPNGTIQIASARRQPVDEARRLFNVALLLGNLRMAFNGLLKRHNNLKSIPSFAIFRREYSRGLVTVPIQRIVGSENRSRDFDRFFHPLSENTRERWIDVAASILNGRSLPPVALIEVDGLYYLRDGHHRVSVASMNGQLEIEAFITVWER